MEVEAGEAGEEGGLMHQQGSGSTIIMRGVTPSKKWPFTVYDLGGGSIEIVNKQGRRACYTASDLDGIVAFVKSVKPQDPLWDASGESNPLDGHLRKKKLRVFSGCLVAFLHSQGRLSIALTSQGHIAAK